MRDFQTKKVLDDPSIVEWQVAIYEGDGSADKIVHQIGAHKCNDKDYGRFSKPSKYSQKIFNNLKESGALFCMNELDIN